MMTPKIFDRLRKSCFLLRGKGEGEGSGRRSEGAEKNDSRSREAARRMRGPGRAVATTGAVAHVTSDPRRTSR
jgi:hypothetical protein